MNLLMKEMSEQLRASAKPRILVVGSKPRFTHEGLGEFDLAFFANGAIARRSFFNVARDYNVLVESAYSQQSKAALATWLQIKDARSPRSILLQSPAWLFAAWNPKPPLGGEVHLCTLIEKRAVVTKAFGWLWAIRQIWLDTSNTKYFAADVMRFVLRGQCASMKPSTGIWCVLLASLVAARAKRPCEIVVSGIGLANDGYAYTSDAQQNNRLHGHGIDLVLTRQLVSQGISFLDMD